MTCSLRSLLVPAAMSLALACASGVHAEPAGKAPAEVSIPFANRGGIRDWRVEDDANLLLQDRQGQWYRARLLVPAYYLAYAGQLSFSTGPSGALEKLDSVVVRGQKYPIVSLTRIESPAKPGARSQ